MKTEFTVFLILFAVLMVGIGFAQGLATGCSLIKDAGGIWPFAWRMLCLSVGFSAYGFLFAIIGYSLASLLQKP